ncbi:MAG: phage holin family protein [Deltaproteobacteria bacterium HGW-Deltaproteobacteria-19]|jgi:putative membrane protein|nr:MAG: phage holin family protein [Deltaproteobacteria bacterium HGW-Deltaproteobacteria-19]
MTGLFIRWLVLTVAVLAAAYFVEGIHVASFWSAFFAAAALGVLNTLLKPVLIIVTLPVNILTLGLFTLVINALLLKMASGVIPGFDVQGFWPAVLGALLISIVSWILNSFFSGSGTVFRVGPGPRRGKDDAIDLSRRGDDRWE